MLVVLIIDEFDNMKTKVKAIDCILYLITSR